MNFKEFAIASGQEELVDLLSGWPADRLIPDLYARPMGKLLKEFYVVGGMPGAVARRRGPHHPGVLGREARASASRLCR